MKYDQAGTQDVAFLPILAWICLHHYYKQRLSRVSSGNGLSHHLPPENPSVEMLRIALGAFDCQACACGLLQLSTRPCA